jgi:hypothetical protein
LLVLPNPQALHLLDFFLWGYVKDKFYATKVTGVEDLKTFIRDVITTINRGEWNFDWMFAM